MSLSKEDRAAFAAMLAEQTAKHTDMIQEQHATTQQLSQPKGPSKVTDPKWLSSWIAVLTVALTVGGVTARKIGAIWTADEHAVLLTTIETTVTGLVETTEAEGDIPAQFAELKEAISDNAAGDRRARIESALDSCNQRERQASRDSTTFTRNCPEEHADSLAVLLEEGN